ncbi:CPBP family intramembrane glutamic endopeptidase [Rufibacter roseus]|uniref:CPBP family intramembrane glutamic endopeptidase n=1 Tax=Rufibacter roseus TaxID=1567108 RepID=A0ABW2DP64_9BACT|nr:CPBP family intramembrane glutamic endopeptidase [Rufibacter roseus]
MPQLQTAPIRSFTVKSSWLSVVAGYGALALTYHAAEYAMRFHQHVPLFLGLMLAVIPVAYIVARLQGLKGLSAWGLRMNSTFIKFFAYGLGLGILVNGVAFAVRLWLNMEVVTAVPELSTLAIQTLIFTVGTFLPSLAEDVLTRGYLYGHLHKRMGKWSLVILSAVVYVLNHVYSLNDGPAALIYLFVLGIMMAIPLVYTKNLWYTVGAHWAGNIVYRFSNDVLSVKEGTSAIPGLWELTFFILLFALVNYIVSKKLSYS